MPGVKIRVVDGFFRDWQKQEFSGKYGLLHGICRKYL